MSADRRTILIWAAAILGLLILIPAGGIGWHDLILIPLVPASYVVIRYRWYTQALLAVGGLAALAASVYGIVLLNESGGTSVPGAVLLIGGIALLVGSAITARVLLRKPGSSPPGESA
jgi:hypothetical protein